ncbi:hypothetical protein BJV74DRAFT_916739 [Russula compacta]|nr:hypothetical protein BJV74DRAFT_916739 [Russula compacta]
MCFCLCLPGHAHAFLPICTCLHAPVPAWECTQFLPTHLSICICLGTPACTCEQVMKDPPNSMPLAEDLIAALCKLQLGAITVVPGGHELILDPKDGVGISMYIEDCNMKDLGVNNEWD